MEIVPKTTDTMSPRARQLAEELEEASQQTLARWRARRAEATSIVAPADPVQLHLEAEA